MKEQILRLRTCFAALILVALTFAATACMANADTTLPKDITLPNGIRLIIQPETTTDLVAMHVFIRAGAAEEDARTCGIGSFVASTLFAGTKSQTGDQIQYLIGALGNNVSAAWDPDYTQIHTLTLASRFEDASFLISDVLKDATFSPTAVEDSRKSLLAGFQSRTDDLFTQVYDNMRATLYVGTPRSRPMNGDPEVIKKLSADDLRAFYAKYYVPKNIVISVVGNISADKVESSFRANLGEFPRQGSRKPQPVPTSGPTPIDKPITVKKYRNDLNAEYIMLGYLAPGSDSKDYPAMQVANALLGGMKTSRLFMDLREKQGMGYEVSSIFPTQVGWSDESAFIVTAPTKDGPDGKPIEITGTVRDAMLDEVKQFRESKPADDDLARAKRYLIGAYLIAHERIERRAYFLGYSEIAQKSLGGYQFDTHYADAINAVTFADVQRVAKQYLSAGAVISMVLPGDPNAGVVSK